MKRMLCLMLVLVFCLSGCRKETAVAEVAPTYSSGAMGRYVESTIPLPQGSYAKDMVLLNDGRLRLSMVNEDGTGTIYTSGADRKTWEGQWSVPEEILSTGSIHQLTLSPLGNLFCLTWEGTEGDYVFHFWAIEKDGTFREIPVNCPDVDTKVGYLISYSDFTDDGRLFAAIQSMQVRQIDLTTGQVGEDLNALQRPVLRMDCAGEDVFITGWETVAVHSQGETTVLDNTMGQQLADSLKATEGNIPRLCFWRNNEGYLLYTTHEGLFSFIPGGSITEEVVSGARSSMGDPSFLPVALAGTQEDSFYVLGSRSGGEYVLLHYAYDAEVPTVADTQLKIYSLYESEDLSKMVSQFQVAYPEVMVDLEIGMDWNSGITASDALRTLNTEILAGNGPDLICLDGFNLES